MDEIERKQCSNPNCIHGKEYQPVTNFRKDASKSDGYRTRCKDCDAAYVKNNHDTIIKKDRARYQKRKKAVLKQKKEYENQPAKYDTYYEKLHTFDECQRDPKDPDLLQVRCKYCGNWFNPTMAEVRRRIQAITSGFANKRGEANLYCSDGCKRACPIYGQVKYPKGFKNNSSREVQPELRKMVLERDNWTCQKCGKSKEEHPDLELHCHHIFPLNEDPICSADIDNCETLCKECHNWIHMNVPGCGKHELRCSE